MTHRPRPNAEHMLGVTVNLELDGWPEVADRKLFPHNHPHGYTAGIRKVGLLPNGTQGGRATVMVEVVLPTGELVLAETSWRLFRAAASALMASPVAELEEL